MAKKLTVNRQQRNIFTVNRQMSEPKLAVKFLRPIDSWIGSPIGGAGGNTSSGNGGDVITLKLTIGSCFSVYYQVMEHGKFEEHERSIRVTRGNSRGQL